MVWTLKMHTKNIDYFEARVFAKIRCMHNWALLGL